jgi:hypothetical protein
MSCKKLRNKYTEESECRDVVIGTPASHLEVHTIHYRRSIKTGYLVEGLKDAKLFYAAYIKKPVIEKLLAMVRFYNFIENILSSAHTLTANELCGAGSCSKCV